MTPTFTYLTYLLRRTKFRDENRSDGRLRAYLGLACLAEFTAARQPRIFALSMTALNGRRWCSPRHCCHEELDFATPPRFTSARCTRLRFRPGQLLQHCNRAQKRPDPVPFFATPSSPDRLLRHRLVGSPLSHKFHSLVRQYCHPEIAIILLQLSRS